MKYTAIAAFVCGLPLACAQADPATDIDDAIRQLLAAQNFTWKVSFERTGDNPAQFNYDGKTERGGYTVVMTSRRTVAEWEGDDGEIPALVVYFEPACVVKIDGPWLTPQEMVRRKSNEWYAHALSTVEAIGRKTNSAIKANYGYLYAPRPDLILSLLAGRLENVAVQAGAMTADIDAKVVAKLLDEGLARPHLFGGSVGTGSDWPSKPATDTVETKSGTTRRTIYGAPPPIGRPLPGEVEPIFERHKETRGTATFWIRDGVLLKYELVLDATVAHRGIEQQPHVEITTTLDDIGTTDVDAPEDARKKLGR